MFCYKCGKRLPARVVNCPECDTPQKRRQRYRRRMILGLFIFLAGAIAGSVFDTFFFKGRSWDHSFLGAFSSNDSLKKDDPVKEFKALTDADSSINKESQTPTVQELPIDNSDSKATILQESQSGLETPEVASITDVSVEEPSLSLIDAGAAKVEPEDEKNIKSVQFPEGKLKYVSCEPLEKGLYNSYHGSFSRDGFEIIFASNRINFKESGMYQCFIRKTEPGSKAELMFPWKGNVWTPELTPDSKKVVFSSDSNKPEHIFIYDRSDGKSLALTSGSSKNMMPAISPDGQLVAFVSNRKGTNSIWLMGIDGSNLLQLTSGREDDREPRWALDGRSLIFTRIYQPLKKSDIMRIQLDPVGEPSAIVSNNKRNWLGDISPDGSALAYVRSESLDGSRNTLVLRQLISGEETLVKPLGNAECFRPVWKSDCSGFVFHASVDSSRSLFFATFGREP